MYIPIEGFWSYVQTRMGTLHKILRCLRSNGGTPHIRNLVIWSEVQTKVGTSHKVLQCFRSQGGDTAHSI